jgi:hypothetical protein
LEQQKHLFPDKWRDHWWPELKTELQGGRGAFAYLGTQLMSHPYRQTKPQIAGYADYHSLESLCSIGQSKSSEQILKKAQWPDNPSHFFTFFTLLHINYNFVTSEHILQLSTLLHSS